MNKLKTIYFLLISFVLLGVTPSRAQDDEPVPLSPQVKANLIKTISSQYTPWKEVSMSGKISMQGLPLSPSVKIYMVKDELIVMSVSTIITGEAFRLEVDRNNILAVNKLSNTYTTVGSEMMESIVPGGLQAMQNLLLGRVNILGKGELTSAEAGDVEIYDNAMGDRLILPNQDFDNSPYVYMFIVGRLTSRLDNFIVMTSNGDAAATITYSRADKETTMEMNASAGGKTMGATLRLSAPDSSPKKIDRLVPDGRYRKTDLKGLMNFF